MKENSALHYTAFSGNTNTARLLLKLENGLELDEENVNGSTPLSIACMNNHRAMVEFLIGCKPKLV